ncbi:hypothetical protein LJC42_03935 [Eubacteriales bacterium OttesenSCG-928-K08]|nr:hypothetical protein [Eubacteriales bacterium OttesenSCG-928-K08]
MVKKKVRGRFYVIIFPFVAAIGVGLYFLFGGGREGELETGTMRLSYPASSVIIRDEQSISTEKYDRIVFSVAEGARVSAGDQIAEIFKWGYQEETMQALIEAQQQILEYQLTLMEGIVNQDLTSLVSQINAKQDEIRAAANGKSEKDMLALEQELKALLNSRMELLRGIHQADETLTSLYQKEEQQQNNLSTWKRVVSAENEGVVSFYFDGYEKSISAGKLELLNADQLASVLKGAGAAINSDSSAETPLYRLIDDQHFYIAFLTDSTNPFRVVNGMRYTVVFAGYADKPFEAVALAPVIGEKQVVNILEINGQPMGDLMGVRLMDITLMQDVAGLSVPLSAITVNEEGLAGITRVTGNESVWVQVDVLAANEDEAIIQAAKAQDNLMAGIRYKK